MQRLFSSFPDGLPGIGLLLLRTVVGVTAAVQGAVHLATTGDPTVGTRFIDLLAIASGASLMIGFLTPGTGAIVGLSITLFWFPTPSTGLFLEGIAALLIVTDAVAIACLGPGAFSVDARLFGRREILIPRELHRAKS